jgi:hypothetical protein
MHPSLLQSPEEGNIQFLKHEFFKQIIKMMDNVKTTV